MYGYLNIIYVLSRRYLLLLFWYYARVLKNLWSKIMIKL